MTDDKKAFYAALGAADEATERDLRGMFPMAARVLATEVRRLRLMEQRMNVARAMCNESVGRIIDPATLLAVLGDDTPTPEGRR